MMERITSKDLPFAVYKGLITSDANTRYFNHIHQELEINLVIKGSGYYELDNNATEKFREGDIIIIPGGAKHDIRIEKEVLWEIIIIHPDFFNANPIFSSNLDIIKYTDYKKSLPVKSVISSEAYKILSDLFYQAYMEQLNKNPFYQENLSRIFYLISTQFARIVNNTSRKEGRDDLIQRIFNVKSWIDVNFEQSITVTRMAEIACISESHFLAKFKELISESPMAYVKKRRMEKACYLLIQTKLPIVEIAISSGFSDLSNFNHQFKDTKDITPSQFRKENQQNKNF